MKSAQSVIQITDHLGQIRARVTQALRDAHRSEEDLTIVAVSKQQTAESIRAVFANGITHFGESYIDEALDKIAELSDLGITWHFIGRIQSNKTRRIAQHFAWVHSVDRERIAARLNEQRPFHAPPLNVLIQVNCTGEETKGGVAPEAVAPLAERIAELSRLRLRGIMGIPPAGLDDDELRAQFDQLSALYEQLSAAGHPVDTLSMGMSRDFPLAIAAGSNCVRIGTALFGPRQ